MLPDTVLDPSGEPAGVPGNGVPLVNEARGSLDRLISDVRMRAVLVLLAASLSLLWGLARGGLDGIREARVAACVTDIVVRGHWLLPELRGVARLEKPALPYWLIAGTAWLSARWDFWTLRLPGVLLTGLVFWSVWRLASDAAGARAGMLASLFLASSVFFVHEARQPSSDLYLTCFASGALAAWWSGYRNAARRTAWWVLAGALAGLAFECKGPVAFAVLAPPLVGYRVWQRESLLPRSRGALAGCTLALLIGLAWPVAVLVERPDAWVAWLTEIDQKAGSPRWDARSPFFYVMQWGGYLFPWSVLGLASVGSAFSARGRPTTPVERFAWLWFFGDLLVFSVFRARKIHYLAPAVPGLAVLAATLVLRLDSRRLAGSLGRLARLAVSVQFLLLAGAGVGLCGYALRESTEHWPAALAAAVLAAAALGLGWRWRGRSLASAWGASGALAAAAVGATFGLVLPSSNAGQHHDQFALQVRDQLPAGARVYFWGDLDPSFWFYLDGRIEPVAELAAPADSDDVVYFLVPQFHIDQQPELARRMDVIDIETTFGNPKYNTVLARSVGPLDGVPIIGSAAGRRSPRAQY